MATDPQSNHRQLVALYRQQLGVGLHEISEVRSYVHRQILLCTVLEALAKARFQDVSSSKERFLLLLETASGWEDFDRINLPRLLDRLEERPELKNEAHVVRRHVDSMQEPGEYPIGRDPWRQDVGQWPRFDSSEVSKLVESAQHGNLLYAQRCGLVHESRSGEIDLQFGQDKPYYYFDGAKTWRHVYPLRFLQGLVEHSLEEACRYFVNQDVDPWAAFDC